LDANIKLYQGDLLKIVDTLIDNNLKVDSIIADPPYGTTACQWDSIIPLNEMWIKIEKIIKPNGTIVLFGSEPFSSILRTSNLKQFKYDFVWEKNNAGNFQLVNYQPLKIHETISIFINEKPNLEFSNIMKKYMKIKDIKQMEISKLQLSKNCKITGWVTNKLNGSQLPTKVQWEKICNLFEIENKYDEILNSIKKPTYNTFETKEIQKICSNKKKAGNLGHLTSETKRNNYIQNKTGYPKSILKYNRENKFHPTQKPIKLMEFLIKTYTNENEIVLDFCMGSGSTGIACLNTNRKFVGIELEKKYFDIAKKRIFKN